MFSAEDSLRLALEIARQDGSVAWEQRVSKEISAVPMLDDQPISASR